MCKAVQREVASFQLSHTLSLKNLVGYANVNGNIRFPFEYSRNSLAHQLFSELTPFVQKSTLGRFQTTISQKRRTSQLFPFSRNIEATIRSLFDRKHKLRQKTYLLQLENFGISAWHFGWQGRGLTYNYRLISTSLSWSRRIWGEIKPLKLGALHDCAAFRGDLVLWRKV